MLLCFKLSCSWRGLIDVAIRVYLMSVAKYQSQFSVQHSFSECNPQPSQCMMTPFSDNSFDDNFYYRAFIRWFINNIWIGKLWVNLNGVILWKFWQLGKIVKKALCLRRFKICCCDHRFRFWLNFFPYS